MSIEELSQKLQATVSRWNLSQDEATKLLPLYTASLNSYAEEISSMSEDQITHLWRVIGIQELVDVLYPPERSEAFLRASNRYFDGRSAMDVMLAEPVKGVAKVHKYLHASIQGGYL